MIRSGRIRTSYRQPQLIPIFEKTFLSMQTPPVSLENLTEAEKELITNEAQKGIKKGLIMFIAPILIFGYAMIYMNNHYMSLGLTEQENLRSVLNLVLVILTILPMRLLVNTFLRFRKATNSWQKKVIRGKVVSKNGKTIVVANQKIKLNESQAQSVKVDDNVIASVSVSLDFTISLDVIHPQS